MKPQPRNTHPTPAHSAKRRLALLGLPLAACLLLASCADEPTDTTDGADQSSSSGTSQSAEATFPVTVASGQLPQTSELVIEEEPTSIVSLSPTATETLWAVGAGDQVVAVDDQSDYPEDVPTTKLSGYTPNTEAILGYEPDLVVTASEDADLISGLAAAGVPTLVLPSAADLDEAYSQIERIGAATGHIAEAAKLVAEMQSDIEAALEDAPQAKGLTYFHELDPALFTVSKDTFIGEVYGLFGMVSIGDAADDGDAYPQLSAEYVVSADPDVVVLADGECCDVTPEAVAKRPGWAGITAVRQGRVHMVNEDIASRWGPRVVDFIEDIDELIADVEPAS